MLTGDPTMKRVLQLLLLLVPVSVPVSAFAWGCLELPAKSQRQACWEKLQNEARKPVPPEQKAIEEQNLTEARARLAADKESLRLAMQARATQERLDREDRLRREMALLREQQYPPTRWAGTPRLVTTYGLPHYPRLPAYPHHPGPARHVGMGRRL
jgi:hypothetical protein